MMSEPPKDDKKEMETRLLLDESELALLRNLNNDIVTLKVQTQEIEQGMSLMRDRYLEAMGALKAIADLAERTLIQIMSKHGLKSDEGEVVLETGEIKLKELKKDA
jgi:hypothetical protein